MRLGKNRIENKDRLALLLIGPALAAMIIVHIIPIIWGIYISFIDLDVHTLSQWTSAPFVGFGNFIEVFTSGLEVGTKFMRSLWNIIWYGIIVIPIGLIISMSVALLINRPFFGKTIVQGLILLPYITPDAVMYNVLRFIFQARIGILNKFLYDFGFIQEPIIWLVGDRAMIAVILASLWKGWPFTCLILLAGLQKIPEEQYEAAKIDGANPIQRFFFVTIPTLWPLTKSFIIFSIIWNFHAFNQFYVMLGGDLSSKAAIPNLVILNEAFTRLHYGLGAAMSVIMLLIVFVLTFFAIRSQKEEI